MHAFAYVFFAAFFMRCVHVHGSSAGQNIPIPVLESSYAVIICRYPCSLNGIKNLVEASSAASVRFVPVRIHAVSQFKGGGLPVGVYQVAFVGFEFTEGA
jgi:hypothetical protein